MSSIPIPIAGIFGPFYALLSSEAADNPGAPRILLRTDAGRRAADHVLEASRLDDLRARLDELSVDEEFYRNEMPSFLEPTKASPSDEDLSKLQDLKLNTASLEVVLGAGPTSVCAHGLDAFKQSMVFLVRLRKLIADEQIEVPNDPRATYEVVSDFVYDASGPAAVRAGASTVLRSLVAMLVIARAEEKAARVEPWLGMALAQSFAKPYTWLIDTVNGGGLVEALSAMYGHDSDARKHASERWEEAARATGESVYFPFGDSVLRD